MRQRTDRVSWAALAAMLELARSLLGDNAEQAAASCTIDGR